MTHCERFEREGLLRLEQGLPLDPHFDSCPDCLEARRAYDQLAREITDLDATVEPLTGWQARVWTRIKEERDSNGIRPRAVWRWTRWLIPAGALASIALFALWPAGAPPPAPSIEAQVVAGQTVLRGSDAHPGDGLRIRATMPGTSRAELRVYFNDREVIVACAVDLKSRTMTGPCVLDRDTLTVTVLLKSLGKYRPALIVAEQAIPPSTGIFDTDAGAALRAGAQIQTADPISVR